MSENRVIARGGDLPWHLPDDLARFKRVTRGHPIIMGRATMDTLPGALSERYSIVVTRDRAWSAPGVEVVHSLEDAFDAASKHLSDDDRVYVVGGGQIYAETIGQADELDLTRILGQIDGDTFFPEIDEANWRLDEISDHPIDDRHALPFRFELWRRRSGS